MTYNNKDIDNIETQEWIDAIHSVLREAGSARAHYLVNTILQELDSPKVAISGFKTEYKNTIALEQQADYPGDLAIEKKLGAIIRWNALALVVKANRKGLDLGGHIGSYASIAELYEVGFNHFWKAQAKHQAGDLVFFQGHTSPGVYARSFIEGQLSKQQLDNFRQEVDGKGISSYPHPWLMPDYWQFPTVSMGLGPLQAIYQAKYIRYLESRKLINQQETRKVWCFCGDGEMDEPESLGALTVASRENLDNLIFVVNCNLQRLDGPVRGNGKIIQELEGIFAGAGWNVIKVITASNWQQLLDKDEDNLLQQQLNSTVDGEFQNYVAHGGAYMRESLLGAHPKLAAIIRDYTDEQLSELIPGGLDRKKVFAAYHAACNHQGQPTVILAKTIKGYGLGDAGEGLNTAHNTKKMTDEQLTTFAKRFNLEISQQDITNLEYIKLNQDTDEMKYLQQQRDNLGGSFPKRNQHPLTDLQAPKLASFDSLLQDSKGRELSTTMAFVRLLGLLCKDKQIGKNIVPIIPDEARTFGMEGLFRQLGIYSSQGQLYKPVDAKQVMFYKEAVDGQILEEGINEAGAFCSWLAAATAYSVHQVVSIPFYIYYSMFGFQRIGDLAWAAGDSRARGFLIGATAGRTTLNGEGLQHEDGHSHILAGTIPNCVSYDPTFSYELAVIVQDGLRRMLDEQEDVFYYITAMNENYQHPAMPKGAEEGIKQGLYQFKKSSSKAKLKVELLGSGTILLEVIAAAEILEQDYKVAANIWSVTSFNLLGRDGQDVARYNLLHPTSSPKSSIVQQSLGKSKAPVVAATDYIRQYAEQIRPFIDNQYITLGTDGFGRSDSRENLRRFFEVNRYYIVIAALNALANEGEIEKNVVKQAITKYKIDPKAPNPLTY